jgi:hypothetical protein
MCIFRHDVPNDEHTKYRPHSSTLDQEHIPDTFGAFLDATPLQLIRRQTYRETMRMRLGLDASWFMSNV